VMFRHGSPARLTAIVAWDMVTMWGPKLDLGWVVQ